MDGETPTDARQHGIRIERVEGQVHTGSGDVNILVADLPNAVRLIRQLIPDDNLDAVDRIVQALREVSRSQKIVSELKRIHNMLHELELALAALEVPIRTAEIRKRSIDVIAIRDEWRMSIQPRMRNLSYFAQHDMKFLEQPLQITSTSMDGPSWAIRLLAINADLERSLDERDKEGIPDLCLGFLDTCRELLYYIDRQLLDAIGRLDQLTDHILRSVSNEAS